MIHEPSFRLGDQRSVIRELFEYGRLRAAQVGEENVFDYSLGNPSIPSPPQIREAIEAILAETDSLQLHGYTTAVGDLATREAVARDLNSRYGTNIHPQELFIGSGAAPELTAVIRALAFPGAEFIAIAPYFPEYRPFVENSGGIFRVATPEPGDFGIPLESLAEVIGENTAAVIVNSPNNPSGAVYSREALSALAALLEEKSQHFGHSIYIIADDPYRELAYDGVEVPFIPTLYRNTVVCYSYSKSLSLPGERIGYIYVPHASDDGLELYAAVAGAARGMGHVCAPSLWQKVIARCAHLRPDLQAYDKNRRALWEGLTALGYETATPEGAFYLFVKAPGGDASEFSRRAKEKDLLVVPGDGFGYPGYFRLCYCVSYDKIIRSLPVFGELIKT